MIAIVLQDAASAPLVKDQVYLPFEIIIYILSVS